MKEKILFAFQQLTWIITIGLLLVVVLGFNSYRVLELPKGTVEILRYITQKKALSLNLTTAELSHLIDVRNLYQLLKVGLLVSTLLCAFSTYFYQKIYSQWALITNMLRWSLYELLMLIVSTVLIITNFVSFWHLLHKVFFTRGNWSFKSGVMIKAFPLSFFQNLASLIIAGLFIILFFQLLLTYYRYRGMIKNDISK